ncbi:MAG TPA: FAD-dependent oxidoreductase, partial [bacterium]|nr:FAD-dependent oxidoreductase [bacterium]
MKRVLIVGGGTGGTMLANTLDRRRFDVTVLSRSSAHIFQPAFLYVAFKDANPATIVRDERRLLARHVRFVEDAVTRIDLGGRTATTGGARYEY